MEKLIRDLFNDPYNRGQEPEDSIFVFYDKTTDLFKYWDGGFDLGMRGIDHNSLWSALPKGTKLEKLFSEVPLLCIVPETETVLTDLCSYKEYFAEIIEEYWSDFEIEQIN